MKKPKIWRHKASEMRSLVTKSGKALGGGGIGLLRLRARPRTAGVPEPLGAPEEGLNSTCASEAACANASSGAVSEAVGRLSSSSEEGAVEGMMPSASGGVSQSLRVSG